MTTSWATALFENQMVGVIQTHNRNIIRVNQIFMNLFGYREQELINRNSSILYENSEDYERFGSQIYDLFYLPTPVNIPEVKWKTKWTSSPRINPGASTQEIRDSVATATLAPLTPWINPGVCRDRRVLDHRS